jgi:hypothetical protein
MSLHSQNIQTALFNRLDGDSTLDGLVGNNKIFDDVPQGTAYPYVVIGEETAINSGSKTLDGCEYTLTIHVWSRYRGRKEVKSIMERIYTLLNDYDMVVSGASLVNLRQEFEQVLMDVDGITRHGVIRFRAVVFDS